MSRTPVTIQTSAGTCPASLFRPDHGEGPWPGVLFFMDGLGIRPALFEMGERMAQHGYLVLLPDLFYRMGPYEPLDAKTVFSEALRTDTEVRARLMARISSLTPEVMKGDTAAYLDFLAAHPDRAAGKVGTTGYCMGGGFSLGAAGNFPDRVGAAASFHGARLATDQPGSPHLLAPQIRARVYVAGASEDPFFPEEQKRLLTESLAQAGVDHVVETYPARHGWVPSDTPVHDAACAERHWQALFALFDSTLA